MAIEKRVYAVRDTYTTYLVYRTHVHVHVHVHVYVRRGSSVQFSSSASGTRGSITQTDHLAPKAPGPSAWLSWEARVRQNPDSG